MIETISIRLQNRVLEFLNLLASARYWQIKTAFLCFCVVLFFSFPPYETLLNRNEHDTWEIVLKQIDNPFVNYNIDNPESHNAKRTFRLFVPIVIGLFTSKNIYFIYAVQLIFSVCFFWLVVKLSNEIIQERVLAMLSALCFCFIYAGQVGIIDVMAKFDGIAITCLLAALYFRNPVVISILCLSAAWTDERGLIACSFVFIWWKIMLSSEADLHFKKLIIPDSRSAAVLVALTVYGALRLYLQYRYGLISVNNGIGFATLFNQLNMLFFGMWSAFEGLWIIIILAVIKLFIDKRYLLIGLIALASFVSIMVSFVVLDITRSLIYCVPLFFIAMKLLTNQESNAYIRKVLLLCLLICFIVPTYFAEGAFRIEGSSPLLFKLADLIRGSL